MSIFYAILRKMRKTKNHFTHFTHTKFYNSLYNNGNKLHVTTFITIIISLSLHDTRKNRTRARKFIINSLLAFCYVFIVSQINYA